MQTCAENGPPRLPEEEPFELEFKSKRVLLKEWSTINRKKIYEKTERDEKVRERSRAKKWL